MGSMLMARHPMRVVGGGIELLNWIDLKSRALDTGRTPIEQLMNTWSFRESTKSDSANTSE